jgi:hypothetical protein
VSDFLADMAELEQREAQREAQRKRAHGRPRSTGAGCRQLKLVCSAGCGFIARATRGALERHGMPVCGCGAELELECEQLAAADSARAGLELERVSVAAARRDTREQSSGYRTGACNCASCGRFKPKPADVCEYCGDEPAPYSSADPQRERREYDQAHGYR